ncbi:cytochrome c maturation protein CcmE [Siculibacillus lacustris]|uniref:Cytochrome c-type biogenesis protein CcmE n=1 Tax=Siculibacillus lacustris TaxID=1549641 RepID=A0A4Q9VZ89_9HYPH|nr:cytochrome c maturation protein CcmE [Siculibacillus lacustris]TBW40969.1 cytochrome c maturation protein CcmE [Siculibacillus lacustris]
MTRKQKRLTLIGLAGLVLVAAVGLVLMALGDKITFFTSPSDLADGHLRPGTRLRLGGLVEPGSVERDTGTTVRFRVTDGAKSVAVSYTGILPDLFREGQGTVAEGTLAADGSFRADTVLAKHDEKYMPKEVADALKASGHWQEDAAKATPKR